MIFSERKSIMDSDGIAGSILILALIFIKAFLAVCEKAAAESADTHKSPEEGSAEQKRRQRLSRTFAAGKSCFSPIICAVSVVTFGGALSEALRGAFGSMSLIAAVIIILFADGVVITAVCDGLPCRIVTKKNAEGIAEKCSAGLNILMPVMTPLSAASAVIIKAVGGISEDGEEVTEEEILMMVDAGNVEETQREMISNVFEFDDKDVSDVMTHRTDIVAVEKTAGVSEIVRASIGSGFSRIPVYEDSIDRIVGLISVKDLLCMIGSDAAESTVAKDFMRSVFYVPEAMRCSELFKMFSKKKTVMAVVVDEYGGTAGIVTMEDIVETIVGEIRDEYDTEEEEIKQISEDTYTISGTASPEDVFEKLGLELPDDFDSDTMSGFVISLLGHIPEENEHASVTCKNVVFTALVIEDMCISKLKAQFTDGGREEYEKNDYAKEKSDEDEH